jgi:hypothetical protein
MALKDWKKFSKWSLDNWWIKDEGSKQIFIKMWKYNFYEVRWTSKYSSGSKVLKSFNNRSSAIKFAKEYMRKH